MLRNQTTSFATGHKRPSPSKRGRASRQVMEPNCEDITDRFIYSYLSDIDTPVSLSIWLCWKHKEHKQIAERQLFPNQYNDSDAFGRDLAAYSLLRKASFLETGIDRRGAALSSFTEAELLCRETNLRLRSRLGRNKISKFDANLLVAARKIERLLGEFPIDEWLDSSGFGPGATHLLKGDSIRYSTKFGGKAEITSKLHRVFTGELFSLAYPVWARDFSGFHVVDSNSIGCVPKDAKTERTIAIEPSFNMYLQKGVGALIRSRLRRVGIDLDDQTTNQWLARQGSLDGSLVTVDFSMASDTVSQSIVEELIPQDWLRFFNLLRCDTGFEQKSGSLISYEKHSSMGNGYTFELESLIFWALASSTTEDRVAVYGDDVILPVAAYPEFVQLCEYCGFKVNLRKSHHSGYYRESCGKHYWNGRSVQPFFLKERIKHVSQYYKTANAIRRVGLEFLSWPTISRSWRLLHYAVHESLRLYVPAGVGDCGFVVPFDIATRSRLVKRPTGGIEGFLYVGLREIPRKRNCFEPGLLLSRLRYPSKQIALRNAELLRGRTVYKRVTSHVPQWFEDDEQASLYRLRVSIGRDLLRSMFNLDDCDNGVAPS